MNCLVMLVITSSVWSAVEGQRAVDKIFKVKSESSVQDFSNEIHARKRRSTKKSFVFFDNRSNRTAQLWWRGIRNLNKTKHKFTLLKAGAVSSINTYEQHEWTVTEPGTGNSLMINDKLVHKQKANTKEERAILIIKRPGQNNTDIGEKFVETLIIIDKSVQDMFTKKSKLEKYVQTMMDLASDVYKHQSLSQHGVKIHLVVSKIELLQSEIKLDPSLKENNVNRVCLLMNSMANNGSIRYDHNLFLTRNNFGVRGAAMVGTMCRRYGSCSMVLAKGFYSALTVAHEIAHSLGARNGNFAPSARKIMSPRSRSHHYYSWSTRTQRSLLRNVRRFGCLNNKPAMTMQSRAYPGIHFSMLEQCQFEFAATNSVCQFKGDKCPRLGCEIPRYPNLCKISQRPLDGTKCGVNKWCMGGKCRTKTK